MAPMPAGPPGNLISLKQLELFKGALKHLAAQAPAGAWLGRGAFGAPAPAFGAPAPAFGAPAPAFGGPAPAFGGPAPGFWALTRAARESRAIDVNFILS